MHKHVYIRFYEELNDFLDPDKQKRDFKVPFKGAPSVKDCIENLGVPPAAVDLILVNGRSVPFSYALGNGDRISVYPVFESLDISQVSRLRKKPLRRPKFILDIDLGELAEILRTFGFDALHRSDYKKNDIVELSLTENRTILTRNRDLLSIKEVVRGYLVKQSNPPEQFKEVVNHFDLNCTGEHKAMLRRSYSRR